MPPDRVLFAWQGLQMEAPRDWELGAVSGGAVKGYLRLDDAEMPRFEATWDSGKLTGPVSVVGDRYLKKAKPEGRVKRDARLARVEGADTEFFITHGEVESVHMARRCAACGRVLLARVMSRRGEGGRAEAARMLASLRDHAEGGWMPWALFGLRMATPERFELVNYTVQAGRVDLTLEASAARMRAVRMSLAETLLKRRTLAQWHAADDAGKWPTCRVTRSETRRGEHAAVSAEGPERSIVRRLVRGRRAARGLAWHCPESNAVFSAQWLGRVKDLAEWERFAGSFVCHEGAKPEERRP